MVLLACSPAEHCRILMLIGDRATMKEDHACFAHQNVYLTECFIDRASRWGFVRERITSK